MEYRNTTIHQCVDGVEEDTEVLLPCFAEEDQQPVSIGLWGQRHLKYIKAHKPGLHQSADQRIPRQLSGRY